VAAAALFKNWFEYLYDGVKLRARMT
jgi:hypothetical protein